MSRSTIAACVFVGLDAVGLAVAAAAGIPTATAVLSLAAGVGFFVLFVVWAVATDARAAARADWEAEVWRDIQPHRNPPKWIVPVDGRWVPFRLSGQPEITAEPVPVPVEVEPVVEPAEEGAA